MNTKRFVAMLFLALMLTCPAVARYAGMVYHEVQAVDEFGRPVTNITSVTIYAPGTTSAATIYMDSAGSAEITQPMTTSSTNTTLASGKFYWWGPSNWDYTLTDGTNTHTNNGHTAMAPNMSRIVFPSYLQSISSTTYSDSESATFGSDGDFVLQAGATGDRFTVTPNATDESAAWWFGANTSGVDVFFYAATSGDYTQWDASDESLEFVGTSIALDDDSPLYFGSSTDATIKYDGTNNDLDITSTTALDEIALGATGDGFDVKWWSTTSGDYVLFDYSADAVLFEDNELFLSEGEGLYFGDPVGTGDMKISCTSNALTISQVVADTGTVVIGADDHDVPTTWYGETSGAVLLLTGDDLRLDAMSLCMGEGDQIQFGDALGTGDTYMSCTTNVLTIGQVVADTGSVAIGADDHDMPVVWYAETSGAELTASGDLWTFDGVDLVINDDDIVNFGDSKEFAVYYDETTTDNLLMVALNANDAVQIGDGTTATDAIFQSTADASAQVQFDASGDTANGEWLFGADDHGIDVTFFGATASQKVYWDQSADTWYFGANAEGVDVQFNADTTGDYMLWDEDSAAEALTFVGANIRLDSDSQITDAVNTGTKMVWGTPVLIEFRPTGAETLTYTVPTGYDLIVTDAYGWKIAAGGSGANDDINLQHNDGSAANIFDTEELDSVSDKARFAFDNLDDTENELEAGETLDCVTQEATSVDSIVLVEGYLKTAD